MAREIRDVPLRIGFAKGEGARLESFIYPSWEERDSRSGNGNGNGNGANSGLMAGSTTTQAQWEEWKNSQRGYERTKRAMDKKREGREGNRGKDKGDRGSRG